LSYFLWGRAAGLSVARATGQAMAAAAPLLEGLSTGRLLMEAHACFGYGAAEASLLALWRHGLLEALCPPLAARLAAARVPRCASLPNIICIVLQSRYCNFGGQLDTAWQPILHLTESECGFHRFMHRKLFNE
jgi:tRNA nucleotidyltransferase/poly(A) polymerase